MKITILALIVSMSAFAGRALDKENNARRVKEQIQDHVTSLRGVNGIGITGCNPKTGALDVSNNFVHCVMINTETKEAYTKLIRTYPQGTQIKGVFITIKFIGRIVPQPRMTVGG